MGILQEARTGFRNTIVEVKNTMARVEGGLTCCHPDADIREDLYNAKLEANEKAAKMRGQIGVQQNKHRKGLVKSGCIEVEYDREGPINVRLLDS